jgi:hypothetical protein
LRRLADREGADSERRAGLLTSAAEHREQAAADRREADADRRDAAEDRHTVNSRSEDN